MKTLKTVLIISTLFMSSLSFAQMPDPPGSGTGAGGDGDSGIGGGGAPIGSGFAMLIVMGAAYAGKKTSNLSQDKNSL